MKTLRNLLIAGIAGMCVFSSCLERDYYEGSDLIDGRERAVFALEVAGMEELSRSILPGDDIETKKTSVTLAAYTGGVLAASGHYVSSLDAMTLSLDKNVTYNVYALVNMGDMRAALPSSEADVASIEYVIPSYTQGAASVATRGIPMAGNLGITLGTSAASTNHITVARLLARVNVTLGTYYSGATVTEAKVRGMNSVLKPFGVSAATGSSDMMTELEIETGGSSSSLSAVFYVPENMQGSVSGISSSEYKNPDLNTEVRGKAARLTYLETTVAVKGPYSGTMLYRSYLGNNATTNFDVERNCRYSWVVQFFSDGTQHDDWKRENHLEDIRIIEWRNYVESLYSEEGKKIYVTDPGTNVLTYPDYKYTVDGITTHVTGRKDADWTCTQNPGSGITFGQYTAGTSTSDERVRYDVSHAVAPGDYPIEAACTGNDSRDVAYIRVNDTRYLHWNDRSSRTGDWPLITSYEYSEDRIDLYALDNTLSPSGFLNASPFVFTFGTEQGDMYIAGTHYTGLRLSDYFSIDYSSLPSNWSFNPTSSESLSGGAWFRFQGNGDKLRIGTYPITVSFLDGSHTITANIHVVPENGYRLYLSPASATVDGGASQQLRAEVYRIVDGTKGEMVADVTSLATYTLSQNPQYGTVSSAGLFTGVNTSDSYKNVKVDATCQYDGKTLSTQTHGTATIRVNGIREELRITPAEFSIYPGGTVQLYAYYYKYRNGSPAGGSTVVSAHWEVSDSSEEDYVSVNASTGLVTGVAAGTAHVCAEATVGGHSVYSVSDAVITVNAETIVSRYEMENADGSKPASATLAPGSSAQFYVRRYDDVYRGGTIYHVDDTGTRLSIYTGQWQSQSPAVATVSYGRATGVSAGTCYVNWRLDSESEYISPAGEVTVMNYPVKYRLVMDPSSTSAPVGGNATFTVNRYTDVYELDGTTIRQVGDTPEAMNPTDFTWITSSGSIATVSDGIATAVSHGSATITATLKSTVPNRSKYVNTAVSGVLNCTDVVTYSLEATPVLIAANCDQTVNLASAVTLTYYTWTNGVKGSGIVVAADSWTRLSSSDGYVTLTGTTVSCSALATSGANGYFTVTYAGLTSNEVQVQFSPVVEHRYGLDVTPKDRTIMKGDNLQYSATLRDSLFINHQLQGVTTQDRTSQSAWSVSPSSVASITSGGLATGTNYGTAKVTATLSSPSVSGSTSLAVDETVEYLEIRPASQTGSVGQTLQLRAYYHVTQNGVDTEQEVTSSATWTKQSGSQHVSVSNASGSKGQATCAAAATSVASATVQASYNGKSATGEVTFNPVTTHTYSLTVYPDNAAVYVGETQAFTATLTDRLYINGIYQSSSSSDVTSGCSWSSNSTAVATINSSGIATGVSAGQCKVTASYFVPGQGTIVTDTMNGYLMVNDRITYHLQVSPANAKLLGGYTLTYKVYRTRYVNGVHDGAAPELRPNSEFDWSCGNSSIIELVSDGVIRGYATGVSAVTILLKSSASYYDACTNKAVIANVQVINQVPDGSSFDNGWAEVDESDLSTGD